VVGYKRKDFQKNYPSFLLVKKLESQYTQRAAKTGAASTKTHKKERRRRRCILLFALRKTVLLI
jgi:hypothetical protein